MVAKWLEAGAAPVAGVGFVVDGVLVAKGLNEVDGGPEGLVPVEGRLGKPEV